MKKVKSNIWTWERILFFSLVLLGVGYGLMMTEAKAPVMEEEKSLSPAREAAEGGVQLSKESEILQTMGFSRCGHSVTRRITAPGNLAGADFASVQQYYDLWQIEHFEERQVMMKREIPLFCPMHRVLTVNEAGQVVLTHNQYGDGMAVLKVYDRFFSEFDASRQDALVLGMGFESQEEAEAWLASH